MRKISPRKHANLRVVEWVLFALILAVAAFLRTYRLAEIPPGLTHDEADTGYFVAAVYRGQPARVEAPYGYANEPFSMYSGAVFMHLLGPTYLALRLHSVFFGLLMIVFSYGWARQSLGVPVALGGAALTAVSFWPLMTSRFALNPQPAPALFAGTMCFVWTGIFSKRPPRRLWWAWTLSALCLGASLWAYEVARATAVVLASWVIFLTCIRCDAFRSRWVWVLGTVVGGLVLGLPHLVDPAAWQRSATLATTLNALRAGDPRPLLKTIVEAWGTFTFRGDPFITYNIPDKPIFHPTLGVLFYASVLTCLWNWRKPANALMLLWLVIGLGPSMVVGAWNSTLHSLGVQPVVFIFPAAAVAHAAQWLGRNYSKRAPMLLWAAFAALVAINGVRTFQEYFIRWGESRDVRAAYFHNLAAITDYLNTEQQGKTIALSSPFPDLPHDPFIAALRVRKPDLALKWFDGRHALFFPSLASGERSYLIVPSNAPLDPILAEPLELQRVKRINLRPDDIDPYFDIFVWWPESAFQHLPTRSVQAATEGGQPVTLPANFGGLVELLGYTVPDLTLAPGGTVTLISAWKVLDPSVLDPLPPDAYGRQAILFVHVLDEAGMIVAQDDRLDAPAWDWQPGDRFAQVHRCTLDVGISPGRYSVVVGVVAYSGTRRLPLLVNGQSFGERLFLTSVEVVAE